MSPYPGSPSLSPEAREKVLQTFRHTLALAGEGRNEEALLGCDFILKMDARFPPARRLLETLRGVPVGKVIDLSPFSQFAQPAVEEASEVIDDVSDPIPTDAPSDAPGDPGPMRNPGLDDVVFDDFGSGTAPNMPSSFSSAAVGSSHAAQSMGAPNAPPPMPLSPEPSAPSGLDDFGFDSAAPAAPATPAADADSFGAAGSPGTATAGRSSSGVDPRIVQFLKQGDEALARGNAQEAIDLWSRVFLIDLSNEEASRRIDGARQTQAEAARKIDILLSEGVQAYEAGDLNSARNKFLGVLALSEHDATARTYLNQIDAAIAPTQTTPPSSSLSGSYFLKEELEAPALPSFAEGGLEDSLGAMSLGGGTEGGHAEAERPSRRRGLDIRILLGVGLLLLVAAGVATYWFLTKGTSARPAPAKTSTPSPARTRGPRTAAAPDDPFTRAQSLFDKGQLDAALQVLATVPESDPRHVEAIAKIDQYRSAAAPTPPPSPPSAAGLDQLKIAGMAAMQSSRYIDAVKNLDRYVQARPDDAEATQALARAREQVNELRSAVKSYNEYDYETAIKLLWTLRKQDSKNQDVEEYLLNSYVNSAIQSLQAGNMTKAQTALQEAIGIRPNDEEAQRLLKFARKYGKGATDLLSKIFIKHLAVRP